MSCRQILPLNTLKQRLPEQAQLGSYMSLPTEAIMQSMLDGLETHDLDGTR